MLVHLKYKVRVTHQALQPTELLSDSKPKVQWFSDRVDIEVETAHTKRKVSFSRGQYDHNNVSSVDVEETK